LAFLFKSRDGKQAEWGAALKASRGPPVGAKLFREGVANGISKSFIDVFADKIRSYDLNISPVGAKLFREGC
jgi:hypothetical protein